MRYLILTALSAGMLTCLPAAAQATQPETAASTVKTESQSKLIQQRRHDDRYDRRDRYDRYERRDRYNRHYRYNPYDRRVRSRRDVRTHEYRYGRYPHQRTGRHYQVQQTRYRNCGWERRNGYYQNRAALVSIQICADQRGVRMIVAGSERLVRYHNRYDPRDRGYRRHR